ncbi:MAG: maleylpyruvate isomerase family mycothiol-dependent enzyme [Acidimicrobiales bacterium]|nr:maleylpyruvate isomerase family mycothiol-dependent enzyme [Acidimicrobiales bacterium]
MDPAAREADLARDGRRLIDLCVADLERDVPPCPGWQTRDLLAHVAGAWTAFAVFTEAASTEAPDFSRLDSAPEDDDGLVAFAEAARDRIIAAVAAADPATPVWTWWGERTLAFYQRRAHLETVVHRLDAQAAAGDPTPVDPVVAADGVDEFYGEIMTNPPTLPAGTFHMHQTDGDGEFMLSVEDGRIVVAHEHGKGDAALRASGHELLEVVWGRRPLDGLEVFGDAAVAAAWTSLAP